MNQAQESAQGGVGIGVGAARHRDHAGEFGIAKPGEEAAQSRDREGEHHARAGIAGGGMSGENEDAGADDAADAQRDQMNRPQRSLEIVSVSSLSGFSETTSTIACPPAGPGTMAERIRLAVQPPDPGLADLAILQLPRGGHTVSGKPDEAGLGKIGAAGIAQQNVGLRFFQPRHQPFRQRPLVTHVADQDEIEALAAADHVLVHGFDGERIGLGIARRLRRRRNGSMSAAITWAAPALAAASATRPEPAPKSSTRLPATRSG